MNNKIESQVVLVTGASRGIGRFIASTFGKNGYKVGINYIQSYEKAESLANEIKLYGGEALLLKTDIGDSSQVRNMTEQIIEKWGKLDILINNAGITKDKTILKMNDEEWTEPIRVNLSGSFWCLRECAKIMIKQKEGSIINIASVSGIRGSFGSANYAASKAGLIALTKSAAKEFGRFHIRINAILPGFHLTDMGAKIPEKYRENTKAEHVTGKCTDLKELAEFVLFISQQKSVSGQIFNFDSRIL